MARSGVGRSKMGRSRMVKEGTRSTGSEPMELCHEGPGGAVPVDTAVPSVGFLEVGREIERFGAEQLLCEGRGVEV